MPLLPRACCRRQACHVWQYAHIGTDRVSRADWWLCRQSASSHKELRHAAALLKAAAGVRVTGLPEEGGADLSGQAAPETAWHYPDLAFEGEQHRDALMALATSFETGKPQPDLTAITASPVSPLVNCTAQKPACLPSGQGLAFVACRPACQAQSASCHKVLEGKAPV